MDKAPFFVKVDKFSHDGYFEVFTYVVDIIVLIDIFHNIYSLESISTYMDMST